MPRKKRSPDHRLRLRLKEELQRNPPGVRGTNGQNLCAKIIYIVLETSVRLFNEISSKKIISNNIKNLTSKPNFELCMKHLKVLVKWKFFWCLHYFSRLWNLCSRVLMVNCVWCYFGQLFRSLALRKLKIMDYKMRKIILEQDVCPRFASRFRLKVVLWSIFFWIMHMR